MRRQEREQLFQSVCTAHTLGRDIEWHDQLESTQDHARQRLAEGAGEGALVVAEVQSAGRGRKGDVWESPRGGLWASLILQPKGSAQDAANLTISFARAVRETLHYDFCIPATVREPNDVLAGGRKICGILADASSRAGQTGVDHMILGFGVNVSNPLPATLDGLATTMGAMLKDPPRLEDVLARVLERFEALYLSRRA